MIRVPIEKRSAGLRCYHRRALKFTATGLTTKGQPYQRHPNYKIRAERREAVKATNLRSWSRQATSRILDGLTTRGGQRVLRLKYFDHFILASEIDAAAASVAAVMDDLSGPAQARCVELALHLAKLKKRIF